MWPLVILLGFVLAVLINLLADSLPRQRRPAAPHCPACDAPRPLWHWSGLAAVVLRRGWCPYCGVRRGARAAVVEILGMVGSVALYLHSPSAWPFWTGILAGFLFLLLGTIDLEHRLILHIVSLPAAMALGAVRALDPSQGPLKTLTGGLAGLAILLGMYLFGLGFSRLITALRGRPIGEVAFGFGDVVLGGVLGLTVGWPGILVAVVLGIFAAGVFSLGLVLVQLSRHRYAAFLAIPYGPFLLFGAAIVLYGGREAFRALASG